MKSDRVRMGLGVVALLLPGGLLVLLAWVAVRSLMRARSRALAERPARDGRPARAVWREMLAALDVRALLREARAAF